MPPSNRIVDYFTINGISETLKLLDRLQKPTAGLEKLVFAPQTYFRFPEFDFDDFPLPPLYQPVCSII